MPKGTVLLICGLFLLIFVVLPMHKNKSDAQIPQNMKVNHSVGAATDYTDAGNWMYLDRDPIQKTDLIYFYPTVVMTNHGKPVSEIDDNLKQMAIQSFDKTASAFGDYTNVYVPYYRQIPFDMAKTTKNADEFLDLMRHNETKADVYAALDLYFSTYNNNRPFILAGHSQGSAVLKMVLEDYMKNHPEYLDRMVAAYLVGFPVTPKWLNQNPHLKFATGEDDTGVIISWNTEGPNAAMKNFVLEDGGIVINPLNWKRDETPAGIAENKGSLVDNAITAGIADATIDLKRGVVVCTTNTDYISGEMVAFFGDKSFHFQEYGLYYNNIKENGLKRIKSYFNQHK